MDSIQSRAPQFRLGDHWRRPTLDDDTVCQHSLLGFYLKPTLSRIPQMLYHTAPAWLRRGSRVTPDWLPHTPHTAHRAPCPTGHASVRRTCPRQREDPLLHPEVHQVYSKDSGTNPYPKPMPMVEVPTATPQQAPAQAPVEQRPRQEPQPRQRSSASRSSSTLT